MKKSDIFWQTYLSLEKEFINVSNFIFITDEITTHEHGKEITQPCNSQLETFSPYIADLLIRCCVQIEAISKELYYDNGGTKQRGDKNLFFDEDCLKLIDIKWAIHDKRVLVVAPFFNLTKEENRILRPLKNAHKRAGTFWEKAYQAVKHDRFASLKDGNIKALLHSMAALYLLNLYYRNDSWIIKYQELSKTDFSMIIDAMDILHTDKVDGFCIVSSDSDFTRLAVRLRESGKFVLGMGEKKTPNPFIVSCDKFVYIEILGGDIKDTTDNESTIAPKEDIVELLKQSINDLADDNGWAFLANVGSLMLKKKPDFDSRNYGFLKLTALIEKYSDKFEIEKRDTNIPSIKHVYVKNKI